MTTTTTSKPKHLRLSYKKAALVSAISIAASWLLTGLTILILDTPPDILREILPSTMALCTFVPLLVSVPVTIVFQRERVRSEVALANLELAHAELALFARTDTLTGLTNRDAFLKELTSLNSQRVSGSMLMIDVDHFKSINDSYGHHAGDEALRLIADAIRRSVRDNDLVGRLGGEEFGVFVADESPALGLAVAERIRDNISRIDFAPAQGRPRKLTASVGMAFACHTMDVSAMLKQADRSMYEAKHSGRNRVIVHEAA
jgi:diguanylate cyclase